MYLLNILKTFSQDENQYFRITIKNYWLLVMTKIKNASFERNLKNTFILVQKTF